MKNALKLIVGFVLVVFTYQQATAQYSNKKIRPKYQSYTDSLKNHQYDYVFPIGHDESAIDLPME